MPRFLSVIAALAALLSPSCLASVPWCQTEQIQPFTSALDYVSLPSTSTRIPEQELQQIIKDSFLRVRCDQQDLGVKTCEDCLLAEYVFDLLDVPVAEGLDDENFGKASTLIVHFMHQLPTLCNMSHTIDWKALDYHDVVHEFMEFHDHDHFADEEDHGDTFDTHQLDSLLLEINETYRAGPLIDDGTGGAIDPSDDVCTWGNITLFRSGDVYSRSAVDEPAEGVTEDELANMNSILLFHFIRGDCVREDLRIESEVPEPDDFIVSLFQEFADNETCLIYEEGFESLLAHLGFEDHDDHDHFHADPQQREDEDHDHGGIPDPAHMCMSESALLSVYGLNASVGLSREDVELISPMLVQQVAQGCGHQDAPTEGIRPSDAEVWGYAILSVILVSIFAPLGLVITRWEHHPVYKYIMALMLGIGLSALTGDAFMHLIPQALNLHDHGAHDHDEDEEEDMSFVWKMFLACAGIWFFFCLQLLMIYASSSRSTKVSSSRESVKEHGHENLGMSDEEVGSEKAAVPNDSSEPPQKSQQNEQDDISRQLDVYADSSLGWMVTIGDSFHNFTDGMAIGASYAVDLNLGLSTTIAIFFHEIPHEFGDVAVMLSAGWSWKRILCIQCFTQGTALIGLCIGIPVAQIDGATEWILALAAGLFIYVALSNIVPELVEYFKQYDPWRVFGYANLGIFIGFSIMLLIALFEDNIRIGS